MTTSPAGWHLARFGVPVLVLIFYATAAHLFPFTPDSTYAAIRATETLLVNGTTTLPVTPGIPWVLLVAVGRALHLDAILVAKVFSLLTSSLALLLVYLLAVEVMEDRVFALCATVVVAAQEWLVPWAASGNGMGLILLLVIAALFFMQRNDYLLSVICTAVAAMMAWYAAGLMVGVVLDALVNSRDRRRGVMVAFASVMVFIVVLLPWVLYATWARLPVLTGFLPPVTDPGGSAAAKATLAAAGLLALGLLLREPGPAARHPLLQLTGLLWMVGWSVAVGLIWDRGFLLLTIPVAVVLGFGGLARLMRQISGDRPSYGPAILTAAVLLFVTQLEFLTHTRPAMLQTVRDNDDLTSIAYWIRSGVPEGATVAAERPGLLSHTLGQEIASVTDNARPEFLISSVDDVPGYELVYTPALQVQGADELRRFKIWRKL